MFWFYINDILTTELLHFSENSNVAVSYASSAIFWSLKRICGGLDWWICLRVRLQTVLRMLDCLVLHFEPQFFFLMQDLYPFLFFWFCLGFVRELPVFVQTCPKCNQLFYVIITQLRNQSSCEYYWLHFFLSTHPK